MRLDAATRPRLVRGLTIGLSIATVVIGLWLVGRRAAKRAAPPAETASETSSSTDDGVDAVLQEPMTPDSAPASVADDALVDSCEALAARAREGGPDAVLLSWLCPDGPMDPMVARAALLAVRTADEAHALAPRLAEHPDLYGLARLVAQDPVRPAVTTVPDPTQTILSPVDAAVLAQVQRAHTVIATGGIAPDERTRARALLAKVYLQATQQLGVAVGRPTEPFARLVAGRALHYGRLFCTSYWRMRVRGLSGLFAEVETGLLALTLALEGSPYHGDAARLAVELTEVREYLGRQGPRARIERRLAERSGSAVGLDRLMPLPNDLDRLMDQGFVDLALARGLAVARRPGGPGLPAVEQLLRDALSRAERGEYLALLERRVAQAHARDPGRPSDSSGSIEHAAELPWPGAAVVAEQAAEWLEHAPQDPGLARRYALGRALLLLRARPDALTALLDRADDEDAPPGVREAIPWLVVELDARDDGRRAWLARRVAAEVPHDGVADTPTARHAQEADRRRRYAWVMRHDGRMPRGAGL